MPMRIGANSGSLPKHLAELAQQDQAEALVEAALEEVRLLESLGFYDFKISVKSSHVPTMIRAYRLLASKVPYPLHLGVTEAGTPYSGSIKSAVGMGALLVDGIGDTIRVSLTADPVEEVKTAYEILKALGLRERGPIMIACPSCGRDNVGVQQLAEVVEERLREYPQHFEVAVLGCAVNGPGEAGDADFGIAGGRDVGFVYAHGRVLKKVSSDILIEELFHEIDKWIADGMHRPEAPQDGQASRPGDGGSLDDPAGVASSGNDDRSRFEALPADPARGSCGRRRGEPQAARARRLHPAGGRGRLDVPAARLAGAPEGRPDHPRGDGCDRRPGDADAGAHARGALGGLGPHRHPGAVQAQGPRRPRPRAAVDPRGDGHLPCAGAPQLQAAAADPLPLLAEIPRRGATARRADPGARIHHEGCVLVRPGRGRARRELPQALRGLQAHL